MNKLLRELLRNLENKLDTENQKQINNLHELALNWKEVDKLPIIATYPYPNNVNFQPFPHREIFDNPEKMLFNELVQAFETSILLHSEINDDLPYTIRANFGTVIIASLFGGKVEQRDDNPPWVRHIKTKKQFESILDQDPTDFSQGICPQVIERYKFYNDILNDLPNLQKCLKIVLPDLQGPLDTIELLRGSSIYEDFIMEPEMVEKGLHRIAKAQIGLAKHLQQYTSETSGKYSHQHSTMIKGNILIRNDSAIMISPEMYAEQVAHHDEYVLKEMGGGGIHSCGKIDYNIPEILKLSSIQSFDYGQSNLNNIDMAYGLAQNEKIPLLRIRVNKDELLSGEIQKRFPTGISLVYEAKSFEEAQKTVKIYKQSKQ